MARKVVNRKELRAEAEAAERAGVEGGAEATAVKKAPKKGTPAIKLTLNAPVALKATLAKAGAKGRMVRLAGSATVKQATTTLYLKLSGSWNKKRLAKGTYRMAFTAPGAKVKSVTFRVR